MLPDRHRRLIAVSLEAAAPYGAALSGVNALAVHGLTGITSKVIDLVTSRESVPEAARAVDRALRREGYQAGRYHDSADLENTHPGGRDGAAQWHVRSKPRPHDHPPIGGIRDYQCHKCWDRDYSLGLSRAPRGREAAGTDLGPVLHPEDAAGAKIADLARRGRSRDYLAAADLLDRYSPDQLIGHARRQDPSLDGRDFAGLARRLDTAPEVAFTAFGQIDSRGVSRLRDRFASWPRDARQADRAERGDARERPGPGRERTGRSAPPRERTELVRAVPVLQPRAEPARPQPGTGTTAGARARPAPAAFPARQPPGGTRRSVPPPGRQRGAAARSEPDIGR